MQAPPIAVGSTTDSYKTFGGDESRNRILAVTGTPGAHLYSISLSKPAVVNAPQAQGLEQRIKEDEKNGMTLGVMPVVDRGELFFQDGERIYGLNLESGVPLPGWEQAHGADHDGAYTLPNVTGSPREHQLTLTVSDHAILAVMGQEDVNLARAGLPQQGETRLVCLDRLTGNANWVVSPSAFKQTSLKLLQFVGSPLVVSDNVLLVANASKQAGFEDCYVLCFDLATGTLRWSSNVASASTVAAAWAGVNPNIALPQNETHLAYANGRVYVQTNRGAVAALDAYNGTIAWLDIYPRGQQAMMNPAFNPMFFQPGQFPQNQTKPWAFNPIIVSQGMLFTLPTEGKHLFIYDAASGQELKRIDLADLAQRLRGNDAVIEHDTFDTLAGVVGDKLILVGTHTVVALNWKTYDADHYDDMKMLFWDEPFAKEERGRPFLTASRVFIPLEDRLYQLDLKSGSVVDAYPTWPRTWDENEEPGNVLVTSDHMIIANSGRVDVYTDLEAAKKKLDREVAEAPNDPQPRLRYAEVMYAAGDYDTSMVKLDEAIQRLGGRDSMQPGPARDRVFSDALTFAQKLKAAEAKGDRERVEQLFDRAGLASLSAEQKVQYRMARARFDELKDDPPSALKLYQEILADPAMRAVPLPDEATNMPASADMVAREQVANLIKRDPQIYDAVEAQAGQALEQAQGSNDPAKLLEVARMYPNSTVATKASLAAADAYETAGDIRAARHVLTDIYFERNEKAPQWPMILEAMARTDPRTAAHMLSQGVEELHDPLLAKPLEFPGGVAIAAGTPFSVALEQVRKVAYAKQSQALPLFNLPVPPVPPDFKKYPKPFVAEAPVISNVDALAVPLRDFARADRIVTWSSAPLLSVYAAGSDKVIASSNEFPEAPKGSAWIGQDLLVWGVTHVALFKHDGAEAIWKMDIGRVASIEVIATDQAAGPENAPVVLNNRIRGNGIIINQGGLVRINGVVRAANLGAPAAKPLTTGPEQITEISPIGERVLISTTTGRVISLETQTGRLAWQTRLSDRPMDRLLCNEDFTVIKAEDDANVRLAVLDTYTGHVRASKTFQRASNSFPQNLALSPDGTLVYTLPDRLCMKDLYKPWDQKGIEKIAAPGQASFSGLTSPEQLVISDGRILALTDSGNNDRPGEKFVRLYSLESGEPIMLNFTDTQVEKALSAGTKSSDVTLRVIGTRLYTLASDAAECYDLDHPAEHYVIYGDIMKIGTISQSFFGRDFLIFLGEQDPESAPAAPPAALPDPQHQPLYELYAFGRYQTAHGESNRLDYPVKIEDPAGITQFWQPMDGGLAYLTGDRKLHLLIGAR
jgi:outer membrane protein assembly factor BamB